jgi:hypothetical protein
MKKLLLFTLAVSFVAYMSSCSDDDGGTGGGTASITGITATATVQTGDTPVVNGVTFEASNGIENVLLCGNGAESDITAALGITVGTTSATVDIEFPTAGLPVGNNALVFTVQDAQGVSAVATHVLTITTEPVAPEVLVQNDISSDATWTADNVYVLASRIAVNNGATLTIEAGTIIKGLAGQLSSAKVLIVTREGSIQANGTAQLPIIFTSIDDQIQPGDVAEGNFGSPNLQSTDAGLWGGVIILGDAPISVSGDLGEANIEGIPATDPNGIYGGDNPTDNSGTFRYVSIRHGGVDLGGDGNEINGLTLGGVGSGTTIEWVEIVGNQDDGIEWFGGTVDITNALVWNCGDDGLDTDQDWVGVCENFLVITPLGGSAFELDGPEGSRVNDGINGGVHTFRNGVIFAGDAIDHLVDNDDNTNSQLQNIYFYGMSQGYPPAGFDAIESFAGDGAGVNSGWETTLPSGATLAGTFGDGAGITTEVAENGNSVGPNSTGFEWTWAASSGALAGIGL